MSLRMRTQTRSSARSKSSWQPQTFGSRTFAKSTSRLKTYSSAWWKRQVRKEQLFAYEACSCSNAQRVNPDCSRLAHVGVSGGPAADSPPSSQYRLCANGEAFADRRPRLRRFASIARLYQRASCVRHFRCRLLADEQTAGSGAAEQY